MPVVGAEGLPVGSHGILKDQVSSTLSSGDSAPPALVSIESSP